MKQTACIFFLFLSLCAASQNGFVRKQNGAFVVDGKPYRYIGTNYWYGSLLALEKDSTRGILRLRKELDFLKSKGVTNLRVMAGAEGSGKILGNYRVGPPLQPAQNVFDTSVLYGLDVLLDEMGKRDMKAVIFFSNNWEWSGGFLQYLNWNGMIADSTLQRRMEWEEMRDVISRFYTCEPCKSGYMEQVKLVLSRRNLVNNKRYIDDPVIMSWQLANEPRPMRPAANEAYRQWIAEVAAFIRSKDKRHLISIGHEGEIGTQDFGLYKAIHRDTNIDYLTIHIWPKNWGWMKVESMNEDFDSVMVLTNSYIDKHLALARQLNKPLVIEEFGLPRDEMRFDPGTSTSLRDRYYDLIFARMTSGRKNDAWIGGLNFWAFNGLARPVPGRRLWQPGDEYMGDPPMEEQSLYGVYDNDSSSWRVVANHIRKLKRKN